MKKILVISSFPAPYRVGVFKGLSDYYELDVFFTVDKDQSRSKDYFAKKEEFKYYVLSNSDDLRYFRECVKKLKQYDLVLAYDWYLKDALMVELRCIMSGVPYIINCDGAFTDEKSGMADIIKNTVKKFFIKHSSLCFAGGRNAEKYFEFYGAKPEKIKIHNFSSLYESDILKAPVSQKKKSEIKAQLNLKQRRTVLSIGQFIHRKGFDLLLEAWEGLDDRYQLVIIGGGEEKDDYVKIIKQHNYENVVIIDFLPKETVFEHYRAVDLFVLPTREDIWGLVINEAMACGLSIVSSDRCVAALELVNNGINGCIVKSEDAIQLHNALDEMLALDNQKLYEMGRCSIAYIKEYTVEAIVESHIKNINKVIEKNF